MTGQSFSGCGPAAGVRDPGRQRLEVQIVRPIYASVHDTYTSVPKSTYNPWHVARIMPSTIVMEYI
jgi:hypothetical protein